MKDNDTKYRFVELRAAGTSYQRIADELGVSKQTLINWARELQTELANLKTIELDALRRRAQLNAEARLEFFGEMLGRVKVEILKRDLSMVASEKLIDLVIKLNDSIHREQKDLTFVALEEVPFLDLSQGLNEERWPA